MNPLEGNNENRDFQSAVNNMRKLMISNVKTTRFETKQFEKSNSKLDEVSSFAKSFHYWELLPSEIKCMIIKEVDFNTRFSLLSCSKTMKQIAETVPVCVDSISANKDYFTAAEYGGALKYRIFDGLKVRKKMAVYSLFDKNLFITWLNRAESPLEELEIVFYDRSDDEYCRIEHATIENAKKLTISGWFSVTESYLLSLKCEEIWFSVPSITHDEVRTYVQRWIDGGGPEKFRKAQFYIEKTDQVLNNLEYIEWDGKFRRENIVLCDWIEDSFELDKKCYYIESKKWDNGATLIVTRDKIVFLVTGKCQI